MEPGYGIIGCGSISRFHLDGLRKAGARVVRTADMDPARARAAADPFGARCSTDYRDVLADPEVTVVDVLSPGRLHEEICLAAIAAGKDVICEKTLADNPDQAYRIVQAARGAGVLFFSAYMKRFFPALQKAKELIPSLGIPFSAYARSYQPWGDLYSLESAAGHQWILDAYGGAILKCAGSHILDLLLFLLGRPESVYARVDTIGDSQVDRKVMALLQYPGSLAVAFEAAAHPLAKIGYERNAWDERIEISGTNGRLDICTPLWDFPERNAALLVHYDNATRTTTEHRLDAVNPFHVQMAHFHRCLSAREQGAPTVVDGFNVDATIEAIERSGREGMPVTIDWRGL